MLLTLLPLSFISLTKKIALITDFGSITNLITDKIKNCHSLLIESNYDLELLKTCKRPWEIKQRTIGRYGHLSNEECLSLVKKTACLKLKNLIIAHISEEANNKELVKKNFEFILKGERTSRNKTLYCPTK